jgi:hypothetical protein
MNAISELEKDISNITKKINKEFPELSNHLKNMSGKVSAKDNDVADIKDMEAYYHSLLELFGKHAKTNVVVKEKTESEIAKMPGYPLYPPSEDIYNRGKKEMKINPNDLSKNKVPNEKPGSRNEKDFDEDMSGDDLDVPGSELDDQQESVGSEDEENNYYSLGGDNHNDLEEDKG